ncbi:hypothetical protein GCM10007094_10570 [Pseudovibrio japonicus]|uniref:Uncharacterized protein n=1 Tax=Pseudovibrio japonicus TaxID=366534 RepID=A0ABQ3E635_9HYPH|nr:hypothetical protein [Pseudovibrio japonicus]GHB24407.1 hypothetical protein GCM10007094_10570 [Pseudovibrio japonicus]
MANEHITKTVSGDALPGTGSPKILMPLEAQEVGKSQVKKNHLKEAAASAGFP